MSEHAPNEHAQTLVDIVMGDCKKYMAGGPSVQLHMWLDEISGDSVAVTPLVETAWERLCQLGFNPLYRKTGPAFRNFLDDCLSRCSDAHEKEVLCCIMEQFDAVVQTVEKHERARGVRSPAV